MRCYVLTGALQQPYIAALLMFFCCPHHFCYTAAYKLIHVNIKGRKYVNTHATLLIILTDLDILRELLFLLQKTINCIQYGWQD